MTEEDAKTKWCPFVRAHWSGGVESEYQGKTRAIPGLSPIEPEGYCGAAGMPR